MLPYLREASWVTKALGTEAFAPACAPHSWPFPGASSVTCWRLTWLRFARAWERIIGFHWTNIWASPPNFLSTPFTCLSERTTLDFQNRNKSFTPLHHRGGITSCALELSIWTLDPSNLEASVQTPYCLRMAWAVCGPRSSKFRVTQSHFSCTEQHLQLSP